VRVQRRDGREAGSIVMIVGVSIATFTIIHVVITLTAIATGFVVMFAMLGSNRVPGWTAIFLLFTVLTSVTGFMFPISGFSPALAVGAISIVLLAVALFTLYAKNLAGTSRWLYVVTALASLYLNVFVLIVQSFEKVKILNPLAPQVGPPFTGATNTQFAIAQGVALLFFIVVGIAALIRFRPGLRLSF